MLKQTCDPCPGLAVRFPVPYTFLMGLAVLPQRPGQLHQLSPEQIGVFSIQFLLPRFPHRSACTLLQNQDSGSLSEQPTVFLYLKMRP